MLRSQPKQRSNASAKAQKSSNHVPMTKAQHKNKKSLTTRTKLHHHTSTITNISTNSSLLTNTLVSGTTLNDSILPKQSKRQFSSSSSPPPPIMTQFAITNFVSTPNQYHSKQLTRLSRQYQNQFKQQQMNSKRFFSTQTSDGDDDATTEKEPLTIPTIPMSAEELASNPFCTKSVLPYETPDFTKLSIAQVKPAILEGMRQQKVQIKAITDNQDPPTFENTIKAFELTGELFSRSSNFLGNMSNSDSTDEIMDLEDELTPLYSNHSDDIHFDDVLFKRIDTVFTDIKANPEKYAHLTNEDRRLVEITHRDFVLAGAKLSTEDREQMRKLNEHLASQEQHFSKNLVKLSQNAGVVITDVKELEGLSQEQIDEAIALAKQQKLPEGQYFLNLVNTTRNPLLTSLKNRDTRKKLFEASVRRGLEGEFSQQDIVYEILTTRAKIAKVLGFPNYTTYQLQTEMATPQEALETLTSTVPNVKRNIQREAEAVTKALQVDHPGAKLEAYDWEHYAEVVRALDFNIDPNSIREYFEFNNVINNGVFYTMNQLFGITFKERKDIPVQHPDITVYEIFDQDGESLALFHADYFKRPAGSPTTKSGGAWMSSYINANGNNNQKAVIINNMNIVKAQGGKPTFLTLDEVSTAFHELGHGLHGVFAKGNHESLLGTNVPTDFVECPSTFMEDFSVQEKILQQYAKHYSTGETIPADKLERVIKASKFNSGFETLEYVTAALIDLEWHSLSLEELEAVFAKYPTRADAIAQFEVEALQKHGAHVDIVPPRYKTQYFAHSMTSYSSRYYAYLFSEVLAADCFRSLTGINRENGDKLRNEIYATGNTRDPMESFVAFMGRKPSTDALLIRRGLTVDE